MESLLDLCIRQVQRHIRFYEDGSVCTPCAVSQRILSRLCSVTPEILAKFAPGSIDRVVISGEFWTDSDLGDLTRHPISSLSLVKCPRLTSQCFVFIREMHETLSSFEVSECPGINRADFLDCLGSLESLSLPNIKMSPRDVSAISKLTRLRKLEVPSLHVNPTNFAPLLSKGPPTLCSLSIASGEFHDVATICSTWPSLTSLDLSGTPSTDEDLRSLVSLAPTLVSLSLASTQVTSLGIADSIGFFQLLQDLRLSALPIGSEVGSALVNLCQLRVLDLSGTQFSELEFLLSLIWLRSLMLSSVPLHPGSFADILILPEIETLVLSNSALSDGSLMVLEPVLKRLVSLDVSDTAVGDKGLAFIGRTCSAIVSLNASRCWNVSDVGVLALLSAPASATLRNLSLSGCFITPKLFSNATQVKKFSGLNFLDLTVPPSEDCRINSDIARQIVSRCDATKGRGCFTVQCGNSLSPGSFSSHTCIIPLRNPSRAASSSTSRGMLKQRRPLESSSQVQFRYCRSEMMAIQMERPGLCTKFPPGLPFIPGITKSKLA